MTWKPHLQGTLTQSKVAGTLADHQVMRFSRSGVLQRQDGPVAWSSTVTQLVHLFACLCKRHCFLICIANQRNCVIIVFIQTQRAWIAISANEQKKTQNEKNEKNVFLESLLLAVFSILIWIENYYWTVFRVWSCAFWSAVDTKTGISRDCTADHNWARNCSNSWVACTILIEKGKKANKQKSKDASRLACISSKSVSCHARKFKIRLEMTSKMWSNESQKLINRACDLDYDMSWDIIAKIFLRKTLTKKQVSGVINKSWFKSMKEKRKWKHFNHAERLKIARRSAIN